MAVLQQLLNMASRFIYSWKLWKMPDDEIVKENKAIQKELEEEVTRLDHSPLPFLLLLIFVAWPRDSRTEEFL